MGLHHAKTCHRAYVDSEAQIRLRIAQSEKGLLCPLTESLETTECMNRELKPGRYFTHVQDDLFPHSLRMFDGAFSLNAAHLM